jgi:hypothetical protein
VNKRMRGGKSSELIVAGHLVRHGLEVYVPCVDDQAVDLLVRVIGSLRTCYYEVQIKSVAGNNRIVGLKNLDAKGDRYVIVLHFRHTTRADEFYWLWRDEARELHVPNSWDDLRFGVPERQRFKERSLHHLAETLSKAC